MSSELHRKLVDLYAGGELPQELEDELEWAAFPDPELNYDMTTLRRTVELLRELPGAEFTEETNQRILMRLFAQGLDIEPVSPPPVHLQMGLPIQG